MPSVKPSLRVSSTPSRGRTPSKYNNPRNPSRSSLKSARTPTAKKLELCIMPTRSQTPKLTDEQLLNNVLQSISFQGEHLLRNEELWNKGNRRKRQSQQCLSSRGRSTSVADSIPNTSKAKIWSQEKDFWLGYLPRQQRIQEYKKGPRVNTPASRSQLTTAEDVRRLSLAEDLNKDSFSKEPISFGEQCQRYHYQKQFEGDTLAQLDQRHHLKNERLRARELTRTLNRYRDFTKTLLENLKEVQSETKKFDRDTTINRLDRRFRMGEMERLELGYKTLKSMYTLNPALITELATQHVKNSPGKRWMGLSRDDISKVILLLEKDRHNPDPDFCPFSPIEAPRIPRQDAITVCGNGGGYYATVDRALYQTKPKIIGYRNLRSPPPKAPSFFDMRDRCQSSRHQDQGHEGSSQRPGANNPSTYFEQGQSASQFSGISPARRESRVKGSRLRVPIIRALKPAQLLPLHIPGPPSLHKNVVVRAYSKDMDGREGELGSTNKRHSSIATGNTKGRVKGQQAAVTTTTSIEEGDLGGETHDEWTTDEEHKPIRKTGPEIGDVESGADETDDGITIESFVPQYFTTRNR